MECPRCRSELTMERPQGPYRSTIPRCQRCGITMMMGSELAPGLGTRLGDSVLTSAKNGVTESCPSCLKGLQRLTLTVGDGWVEIEECQSCGLLVFDDGEVQRTRDLVSRVGGEVGSAQAGLVAGGTPAAHAHARAAEEHQELLREESLASEVLESDGILDAVITLGVGLITRAAKKGRR